MKSYNSARYLCRQLNLLIKVRNEYGAIKKNLLNEVNNYDVPERKQTVGMSENNFANFLKSEKIK